jgi:hypothetical protein
MQALCTVVGRQGVAGDGDMQAEVHEVEKVGVEVGEEEGKGVVVTVRADAVVDPDD